MRFYEQDYTYHRCAVSDFGCGLSHHRNSIVHMVMEGRDVWRGAAVKKNPFSHVPYWVAYAVVAFIYLEVVLFFFFP